MQISTQYKRIRYDPLHCSQSFWFSSFQEWSLVFAIMKLVRKVSVEVFLVSICSSTATVIFWLITMTLRRKKWKKCQESCFSGTSGNSGGDGEAHSIPLGAEKRPGTSGNGFPGFPVASLPPLPQQIHQDLNWASTRYPLCSPTLLFSRFAHRPWSGIGPKIWQVHVPQPRFLKEKEKKYIYWYPKNCFQCQQTALINISST